ncbi:hypothetical protein PDIDSM_4400 [Penicillium digitatum]|nr:hypothetical protein PDIDSM_4400 [Penicillium digitatum]
MESLYFTLVICRAHLSSSVGTHLLSYPLPMAVYCSYVLSFKARGIDNSEQRFSHKIKNAKNTLPKMDPWLENFLISLSTSTLSPISPQTGGAVMESALCAVLAPDIVQVLLATEVLLNDL